MTKNATYCDKHVSSRKCIFCCEKLCHILGQKFLGNPGTHGGFHAQGNYSTAVGESYAIMGMKLWAEYLDGIAVVTLGGASGASVQSAPARAASK